MSKPFTWSHTALTSFETCPRRHYLTRVTKEVVEPPSEVLTWGREVHKALEKRLLGQAALPAHLSHCEPLVQSLTSKHGKRLVEEKLTIDSAFRPCGWWDKNAWCRVVVDVGIMGSQNALLGDWKTGRRKPENDQLELFAAVAFAHFPYLSAVHTVFLWLKDKKLDHAVFTHEQVGEIWNNYLPRVKRFEEAFKTNTWHPKPSGLCGKWCPVTRKHCEFGK